MSNPESILPVTLGIATLLPLLAFVIVLCAGPRIGKGLGHGAYISIGAIGVASLLSFYSLFAVWLPNHWPQSSHHGPDHETQSPGDESKSHDGAEKPHKQANARGADGGTSSDGIHIDTVQFVSLVTKAETGDEAVGAEKESADHDHQSKPYYAGDYYLLGQFGRLRLTIGYYIDALTLVMFCMVTLIATCIHVYATGYMHEELHDVTDHQVTLRDGSHLTRPGRYFRFFQYLSLFSFSMLGLVLAGNIAMVFVFWELVGICSYFLIGFYIERKSATDAANKAFIVNRVGDFGMIIGLMALWTGLGTFAFGDTSQKLFETDDAYHADLDKGNLDKGIVSDELRAEFSKHGVPLPKNLTVHADTEHDGWTIAEPESAISYHLASQADKLTVTQNEVGMFSLVRPEGDPHHPHQIVVPERMVRWGAKDDVAEIVTKNLATVGPGAATLKSEHDIAGQIDGWRGEMKSNSESGEKSSGCWAYFLLVIAGVGIFCGCVGKSAQFPLHVWLPDAMEGPTPVSALVHSATMVAAGVYLVGRFYPVFLPEVLFVIAIAGAITLFMAATIAITATDIKRVLAYSTVSQLGYMMLALGVGGWVAGMMHLITHAFFKSLLFLCSGSVIHAVHTNEMPQMGGLIKKMPWTAFTMLVGCLAIAGTPLFSGFYSKDAILEQAYSFGNANGANAGVFFIMATMGAVITAFYMFRMWFMTFVGAPRDAHRYDHAHESPKVMYVPLVILSVFAVAVAWPLSDWFTASICPNLVNLLEQARPTGTLANMTGSWIAWTWPSEPVSHGFAGLVTPIATLAAAAGVAGAIALYWKKLVDPNDVRNQFKAAHKFLLNKWWFDELYDFCFVKPAHGISRAISMFDKLVIDKFIDTLAVVTKRFAKMWDALVDRGLVDGLINLFAGWMYSIGLALRGLQRGKLREYVMFIVLGTIVLFFVINFF